MPMPPLNYHFSPIRTHTEVAMLMADRGYPMSRQRVWQIERVAMEKLKERLCEEPLVKAFLGDER